MIVLIDTTELVGDPLCDGTAWRVLAHASSTWHLRILVPEVAVAEAAAEYGREVDAARGALEKWVRHARRLGLAEAVDGASGAMNVATESYEDRLRRALGDAGAEVIEPPDVPHLELVRRACLRRRPCDSNGNGYRDTLNWLTVVKCAQAEPQEEMVWVTSDGDFADAAGTALHSDLVEDLREVGAEGRVRLVKRIGDLMLELAATLPLEASGDLAAVHEYVRNESVRAYIAVEVLANVGGMPLDPRLCGLPVSTVSAQIAAVGSPRNVRLTIRGNLGDGEGLAEFEIEADTTVHLTVTGGESIEDYGLTSNGEESLSIERTKALVYRGLLTLGPYDRPMGGEVTRIAARSDDVGRRRRAAASKIRELFNFTMPVIPPELFNFTPPGIPSQPQPPDTSASSPGDDRDRDSDDGAEGAAEDGSDGSDAPTSSKEADGAEDGGREDRPTDAEGDAGEGDVEPPSSPAS